MSKNHIGTKTWQTWTKCIIIAMYSMIVLVAIYNGLVPNWITMSQMCISSTMIYIVIDISNCCFTIDVSQLRPSYRSTNCVFLWSKIQCSFDYACCCCFGNIYCYDKFVPVIWYMNMPWNKGHCSLWVYQYDDQYSVSVVFQRSPETAFGGHIGWP